MEFIAKQLERKTKKNKFLKKQNAEMMLEIKDLNFEISMERKQVKHLESQVASSDETIVILRDRITKAEEFRTDLNRKYADVCRINDARADMIQICLENKLDSRDKLSELMSILNDVVWKDDGDNLKAMNLMKDLYELTQ